MKKNIIEVYYDKKIDDDSVVVFQNGKWVAISKWMFLNDIKKTCKELKDNLEEKIDNNATTTNDEINKLKDEIEQLKISIAILMGEDVDEEE